MSRELPPFVIGRSIGPIARLESSVGKCHRGRRDRRYPCHPPESRSLVLRRRTSLDPRRCGIQSVTLSLQGACGICTPSLTPHTGSSEETSKIGRAALVCALDVLCRCVPEPVLVLDSEDDSSTPPPAWTTQRRSPFTSLRALSFDVWRLTRGRNPANSGETAPLGDREPARKPVAGKPAHRNLALLRRNPKLGGTV